ncbi:MAG: type IV secretory system conjugative DNA transfer family protein, partial [Dactylosporangium sp.]|nr:type IV secretory system conjugative DNA transfer family protein [Dactylosporangium sp.]
EQGQVIRRNHPAAQATRERWLRHPEHAGSITRAHRLPPTVICNNVLNLAGSVSDMPAEARGYHLSLVLAHQNLTQVPRDTQLAISANARNKIFFSCSPEDAHQLARHTLPELDEHDLTHLDAYTAAVRLVVSNRQTAAFTMTTRPPRDPLGETTAIRQAVARPVPDEPTGAERLTHRKADRSGGHRSYNTP